MEEIFLKKILENIKSDGCAKGIVIASPSKGDPNYFYHWVRDSAIIIRALLKEYISNDDNLNLKEVILDYVNTEIELQNLDTLGGLGEPKFNVDKTAFNDNWGRPQNDGPALRALTFIEILESDILDNSNINLKSFINEVIHENIIYTCDNIHKPSYDIWEEIYGYHLYTRLIQAKAIKEYLKIYKGKQFAYILKKYKEIRGLLKHHQNNFLISSYDCGGLTQRMYDSSVFLGICHIDFDIDIFDYTQHIFKDFMYHMKSVYKKKYIVNENFLFTNMGRYFTDTYYNGQMWLICTIGLLRVINKLEEDKYEVKIFIEYIKSNKEHNYSEQVQDISMKSISAKKLSWNYAELYNLFREFQN